MWHCTVCKCELKDNEPSLVAYCSIGRVVLCYVCYIILNKPINIHDLINNYEFIFGEIAPVNS